MLFGYALLRIFQAYQKASLSILEHRLSMLKRAKVVKISMPGPNLSTLQSKQ